MTVESAVSMIGAIVPVLSAIASFLNHFVRVQTTEGKEPNKAVLAAGAAINVGALNVDKAIQLAKMFRGLSKAE